MSNRSQFSNFSIQTILGAGSSGTQRRNDFAEAEKNETLLSKIKQEKIEILGKKQQAENGLQSRSGCHGQSWPVMDDCHE